MNIQIYCDGSCLGNGSNGANGGYGAIVSTPHGTVELAQAYSNTTNNRMELRGCIAALKTLPQGSRGTVYSDSKYLIDAFNQGWIENWKRIGWKNASNRPVANQDLWRELLIVSEPHSISWMWVKGHADNPMNNHADALATGAINCGVLLPDVGNTVCTVVNRY
ncbi:MAG: ribonuclease HI [Desulfovibrio sp.]